MNARGGMQTLGLLHYVMYCVSFINCVYLFFKGNMVFMSNGVYNH
jgi:hypothetical protein